MEIEFAPLLSAPYYIATTGLIAVLIIWSFLIQYKGVWFRCLTSIACLIILSNPTWVDIETKQNPGYVIVASDVSQSQKIPHRKDISRRIKDKLLEQLRTHKNLIIKSIDVGQHADAGEEGTLAFKDILKTLENISPNQVSAIYLITDGQVHDVPDNLQSTFGDIPFHILLSGHKQELDRRLKLHKTPAYGLIGKDVRVELEIVQDSMAAAGDGQTSQTTNLEIFKDGLPLQTITAPLNQHIVLDIPIDHAGKNIYEFTTDVVAGEVTAANNKTALVVNGIRDSLRVLLISGEPYPGERSWRNILKSDPEVDLVHFTILRSPNKQDNTPINELALIAFPTHELFDTRIDDFDLIVLDRYRQQGVLPPIYFHNIADYVNNGGALLVATGDEFSSVYSTYNTSLHNVLPAIPNGETLDVPFVPKTSKKGKMHPVTRDLEKNHPDWSQWHRQIATRKIRGNVLMEGAEDFPLLVLSKQDKGRVGLLLSDQSWLWARGYKGGGPYRQLMRRLTHWLMKEPDLEEEALKGEVINNKLVITRQSIGDNVPALDVTSPLETTETYELSKSDTGLWQAEIEAPVNGLYHLKNGNLSSIALVGSPNNIEFSNLTSTKTKFDEVEKKSLGYLDYGVDGKGNILVPKPVMLGYAATSRRGANWSGLLESRSKQIISQERFPLLSGITGLLLLVIMITLTWYYEGREPT